MKFTYYDNSNQYWRTKMSLRETLERVIFDQTDSSSTTPLSIRLPNHLNNQLEELAYSLDKPKSFLLLEFVKAGIKETISILEEAAKDLEADEPKGAKSLFGQRYFMLNTNYNNNKSAHMSMLENHEVAAFYTGWKENISHLKEGDKVYLYQSGVGFVASGVVTGELIKSEYEGIAEAKYSKKLSDFKTGFRAITAKEFKSLTNGGANFLRTMVQLSLDQQKVLDAEIDNRMKGI
jgi:predicted DNA-binding protein